MKQNTWTLFKFYGKSKYKDSGTSTNPDQDKHTEHHTKAHNIELLKVNTKKENLKTARDEKTHYVQENTRIKACFLFEMIRVKRECTDPFIMFKKTTVNI